MKPRHIRHLLKDCKIGEQILFEHNVGQWRNSIGIAFDNEIQMTKNDGKSEEPRSMSIIASRVPSYTSNRPSSRTPEPSESEAVTLSDVLSNHHGNLLIERYACQNCFKDDERLMLIKLVAKYFEDNNIHLSLATSYRMEEEIVARFPTEKAEFYRAGKRGKIYVRFCNNKRAFKGLEETNKRKLDSLEEVSPSKQFSEYFYLK